MKKPPIPSTYEFILAFSSVLFNRFPKRFQRMRENGRRIAGRLQVLYINGAVTHDIIHIMSWVILHMKKEMTGKQFGMLTVLQEAKRENSRKRYWLCRCQCGKETVVEESHLKNGHTKSCGCYRRMVQQKRSRDLTGLRFGRLQVLEAVLGADGSLAGWKCQCDCGKQCVCKSGSLTSGVTRSCGCLQEEKRRENMKKAIHFVDGTCVERIACRKTFLNNTTGHRGVYRRENNRWRASIGFQGKVYYLGSFSSFEDAVEARLSAEARLYDPFLEKYAEEKENPSAYMKKMSERQEEK